LRVGGCCGAASTVSFFSRAKAIALHRSEWTSSVIRAAAPPGPDPGLSSQHRATHLSKLKVASAKVLAGDVLNCRTVGSLAAIAGFDVIAALPDPREVSCRSR
jgi:hypothetical protein